MTAIDRPPELAVIVTSYCVAFYFLALTLKTLPVGSAYAVWAGAGIALIVAGIVVLQLFSNSAR